MFTTLTKQSSISVLQGKSCFRWLQISPVRKWQLVYERHKSPFAIHVTQNFWCSGLEMKEENHTEILKLISSFVFSLIISVLYVNFLETSVQVKGQSSWLRHTLELTYLQQLRISFPVIIFRGKGFYVKLGTAFEETNGVKRYVCSVFGLEIPTNSIRRWLPKHYQLGQMTMECVSWGAVSV